MGTGRIAIIPARGGSKRLPRKNIIDFLGRPIIAYTIDAARESACFDTVVVSTEDEEIASIAAAFDVRVDRRTPELATDAARVVDVCIDLLERERCAGRQWSSFACLYATAPMRTAADIRATVGLLDPGRCEFAMAVTRYSSPPHQALKVSGRGELDPMWPDLVNRRESELPPLVVDNGSTYAVTASGFRERRSFYGPGMRGHEMPRTRSVDIDTPEDLEFALSLARRSARDRSRCGREENGNAPLH